MSPAEVSSVRLDIRGLMWTLPLPLLLEVVLAGACTSPKFSNGESCLKDEDCVSGTCSQLVCAAAPPLTDLEADAAPEAAPSSDATSDTASLPEAAPEATPEAAPEAAPEAVAEASADATED
jgi:hypothetical protein